MSPATDPLQAAMDSAAKMLDGLMPQVKDRFAKAPAPRPRFSMDRVADMDEQEAEAFLQGQIDRHGEGTVEEHVRRQATERLRKRGLL